MDFEDWKELVLDHLEHEGIPYDRGLDDQLWRLWLLRVRPDEVPARLVK